MQTEVRFAAADDGKSPIKRSLLLKLYQAVILSVCPSVRLPAGISAAPTTDYRKI